MKTIGLSPSGASVAMSGFGTSRRRGRKGADRPFIASRHATAMGAQSDAVDPDGMDWDDEIDVLCVGTGATGMAAAMASRAVGLTAWVIGSVPAGVGDRSDRWGIDDPETAEYLKSVTEDITPMATSAGAGEIPVRFIDGPAEPAGVRPSGAVTFVGASLRAWAESCLASPYSVLSTHVADPRLTMSYRTASGTVEAVVIGTVDFDGHIPERFDQWLAGWTHSEAAAAYADSTLRRLLFADGDVVGAIIDAPSGLTAVRVRFGVVLTLGVADEPCGWPTSGIDGVATAEVAFVTRPASRFARLELLVSNPRR